jgi:hypothetical protein
MGAPYEPSLRLRATRLIHDLADNVAVDALDPVDLPAGPLHLTEDRVLGRIGLWVSWVGGYLLGLSNLEQHPERDLAGRIPGEYLPVR